MENKYQMSKEENIFLAKRNIVDYLWKSANLEGIAVTYPDTQAIYDGLSVSNMKIDDLVTINNLKKAWQFLLDGINLPTDFPFICRINQVVGGDNLISQAGKIRSIPVSIGGTDWKPALPIEVSVKKDIEEINSIKIQTQRAITLMLYCMRQQLFIDGNKRTAMLVGNHIMIKHGCGIISVPINQQNKFFELLVEFYTSAKPDAVMNFVYENCIDGLDFSGQDRDLTGLGTEKQEKWWRDSSN